MNPVVSTVEIERPVAEVFAYVTDPSRFHEWQESAVSGSMKDGAPRVGSHCTTTRRIGGAARTSTSELTEYEPPRRWALRGIDGPIRADVQVRVEPVSDDTRSRVTIELRFHGHGLGKLIAPVVVSQARREGPRSCQKLKENLER
jgi:uncharacterized protein YndB with AHSA1/START domain